MSTTEKSRDSSQTPSMLASLLVFGVMIGLILLSVFLFPEEVDAGPLQISMTLATLFAVTELTGMIQQVIAPVINWVQRVSALIAATSLTSIGLNLFTAVPYVSIVLTARMYRDTYLIQKVTLTGWRPARSVRR